MQVAVGDAPVVEGGDRVGDRGDQFERVGGGQRLLFEHAAQRGAVDPFAHDVGEPALVDRVVDVDHRVDVGAGGGHGGGHGGRGVVAAGGAEHHGDAAVQEHVHAPPQLAVAVGAPEVLFEAVALCEQVSHGRHVDRTHGAGSSPLQATPRGVCANSGLAGVVPPAGGPVRGTDPIDSRDRRADRARLRRSPPGHPQIRLTEEQSGTRMDGTWLIVAALRALWPGATTSQ